MINRRHIRLKVMQSLYAYFTLKGKDLTLAQKQMLKQCDSIAHLYLLLLSLLLALAQFSKDFLVQQKQKHFPTNADKNPSEKFSNNLIIKLIRKDEVFPNGIKYVLVSHNTRMGAAKGTVLMAEILVKEKMIH